MLRYYIRMLNDRFRTLLESYQRRKWFPQVYPDPFDRFIDYFTEDVLSEFLDAFRETRNRHLIFVADHILEILPGILYSDLLQPYHHALSGISSKHEYKPEYLFYYLKHLPDAEAKELWNDMQSWAQENQIHLEEWLQAAVGFERRHADLKKAYQECRAIDEAKELEGLGRILRTSLDRFKWRFFRHAGVNNFYGMARYSPDSGNVDWNDVSAFVNAISELYHFEKLPEITRSDKEAAIQQIYPISPPARVVLESGVSRNPVDLMRFLFELGQGVFYTEMNPKLPAEIRITGDTSLPFFWGYFYCYAFAQPFCITRLLGHSMEPLAEEFRLMLEFAFRYEAALSIYRARVDVELKEARDRYTHAMEEAFFVPAPSFLYLYDLSRSHAALDRVLAHRHALNTHLYLSILHGKEWFLLPRFIRRFREYRWEAYGLTLQEIMNDLNVVRVLDDPFLNLE